MNVGSVLFLCAKKEVGAMLTRYRRQNVEGARLLVGERWDARKPAPVTSPMWPTATGTPRP